MIYPLALVHDTVRGVLTIMWDDNTEQHLPITRLRAGCQCADCKSLRRRSGVEVPVDADVSIQELRPVGTYGVQILFTDNHDRGIFPWEYLKQF